MKSSKLLRMQILFLGLDEVSLGATATEVMASRASQMSKVDARIMAMLKKRQQIVFGAITMCFTVDFEFFDKFSDVDHKTMEIGRIGLSRTRWLWKSLFFSF